MAQWKERVLLGMQQGSIDWSMVWHPKLDVKNALDVKVVDGDGKPNVTCCSLNSDTGCSHQTLRADWACVLHRRSDHGD